MKRFFHTTAGKAVLIFLFVISLILTVSAVAVICYAGDNGMYRMTEYEYLCGRREDMAYSEAYWTAKRELEGFRDFATSDLFRIELQDNEGNTLYKSQGFDEWAADTQYEKYSFLFYVKNEDELIAGIMPQPESGYPYAYSATVYSDCESALPGSYEETLLRFTHLLYSLRYALFVIAFLLLSVCIAIYVILMCAAGKRGGSDEPSEGPLTAVPFDLLLAGSFLVVVLGIYLCDSVEYETVYVFVLFLMLLGDVLLFLGLSMGFAARAKLHMLWDRLICWQILKGLGLLSWRILKSLGLFGRRVLAFIGKGLRRIFRAIGRFFSLLGHLITSIPIIWKTVLGLVILLFIEVIRLEDIVDYRGYIRPIWIIGMLILALLVLFIALSLRKLEKAGQALASGDLSYRPDTRGMLPSFKAHAKNLCSISEGMATAVEQRLKSERMKTELITNVSHDLKTPLTSIVNYSSLIAAEPTENAKITEYAEVLLRQSEKLKRLIEDLVEASKASTGMLEVEMMPCDAAVFLSQVSGEYEEKMAAAGLSLVTGIPEEEVLILADGRRMQRIFDNLMNNACKYALQGTRVYLNLRTTEKNAVISFKNISREPLNVSADELMERFVRGDASRGTEGNGLGLSIARSLTELQGGKMELTVDGDLFRVDLSFPLIR